MLRLVATSSNPDDPVLAAHGRIAGEDVAFLELEGQRILLGTTRPTLDLAGVDFVDRAGVELLRRWAGLGVELRGGSAFIRALLKEHGAE